MRSTMKKTLILFLVLLLHPAFVYPVSAQITIPFKGSVDFSTDKLYLHIPLANESSIIVRAEKKLENKYRLLFQIDHLKLPLFELTSDIESSAKILTDKDTGEKFIAGTLSSKYSLMDYKPIEELSGQFEIRDSKIIVNSLTFGRLQFNGQVDFQDPYKIDMVVDLVALDMDDFLNFWSKKKSFDSTGQVFGNIRATGNPSKLYLKGDLESTDGFVKSLSYDRIHVNIEGTYPQMLIANSQITESNGMSYAISGPFDLKKSDTFKKQIRELTLSPIVKNKGTEAEWTIKRFEEAAGATELKYRLRQEGGPTNEEASGMLGIARTLEF